VQGADQRIQAAVDRLLLDQGEYVPLELLLDLGRLSYARYEAWRHGQEAGYLEDALTAPPEHVLELLEAAATWAGRLGLLPVEEAYRGWGTQAGATLPLARSPAIERLLRTRYRRAPAPTPQLDLFLDGGSTAVLNDLVDALAARSAELAEQRLSVLLARYPDHRYRRAAEALCNALARLHDPRPWDPAGEITFLETRLEPLARELLGRRAQDFLAAFWRRAAEALRGQPFDPARDHLHASWAFAQCHDWQAVIESLADAPEEGLPSLLVARRAEALRHLGRRSEAIALWCRVCWQAPEHAARLLDDPTFPDPKVQQAWHAWLDQDLDPDPSPDWFPGWLLLQEPGLAHALADDTAGDTPGPQRAFRILRQLLRLEGGAAGEDPQLDLRRALQQTHPGLLQLYLRRRASAVP